MLEPSGYEKLETRIHFQEMAVKFVYGLSWYVRGTNMIAIVVFLSTRMTLFYSSFLSQGALVANYPYDGTHDPSRYFRLC